MTSKKATVHFIFATILIDALGIGILIPIFPDVIRRFGSDPDFVNHYFGYFISVYALMQFLASPVLGSLSDRYGRRPVLLLSLVMAGLDYVLMAFAPNLWILFLGRVIAGLTGANMTVASSYMADISDDSNRSANFGLIGAGWGIGFIVGPLIGGALGGFGPHAPFLAAAVLSLVNFAWGLFVLPESLPADRRRQIDLKRLNPFASLAKILRPSPILLLVWIYFLLFFAGYVHPSIWTLYSQYKYGWTAFDVGLSLSFVGVVGAFTQGFLTGKLIPRWGETRTLRIAIWLSAANFGLIAFATQGWMLYAIIGLTSLSGLGGPAIQSLISAKVPPQEQGELQGSLMSLGALTLIVAPIIYTSLFAAGTAPGAAVHFPGAPYVFATLICVVSWLLLKMAKTR